MFGYPISYPEHLPFQLEKVVSVVPLMYDWKVVTQFLEKKKERSVLHFYVPGLSREVQMCKFLDNILFVKDPDFETNKKYKKIVLEVLDLARANNVSCVLVPSTKLTARAIRESLLVHSVSNLI